MKDFFTVKEIAEILSVSKPTVQKTINQLGIMPDRIEQNKFRYYNQDNTIKIIKNIQNDFDIGSFAVLGGVCDNTAKFCEKPPNSLQTPPKFGGNTAKQPPTPPNNSELELLKNTLAVLQNQLSIKDKQIAEYQEQLKNYATRLADAMELTKGQQYLAATDKEVKILATNVIKEKGDQPKQGFLKKLFKK